MRFSALRVLWAHWAISITFFAAATNWETEYNLYFNELDSIFTYEGKSLRSQSPTIILICKRNESDLTLQVKSRIPASCLIMESSGLAAKIDHTLLKPDATADNIRQLCEEARQNGFATVCVNSTHVGLAAKLLQGSATLPIAVVGFPLGACSTSAKTFEAKEAIQQGAREIDMVIQIGALKSQDYATVLYDIQQVVEASHPYPVKVILETSSLTDDQKIIGCALAQAAGAAFVKTSTGFGAGGATVEDVALMRRIVAPHIGVKASGGIRTYEDAIKMIAAGANRIGASASVSIVSVAENKTNAR
jgi:deoxyribose-phosphate aldolase